MSKTLPLLPPVRFLKLKIEMKDSDLWRLTVEPCDKGHQESVCSLRRSGVRTSARRHFVANSSRVRQTRKCRGYFDFGAVDAKDGCAWQVRCIRQAFLRQAIF